MNNVVSSKMLRWSSSLLVGSVWVSAVIFGFYILAFYAIALFNGDILQWNEVLPGLYDPEERPATVGIGIHFLAGGIILILGCIQLMEGIRNRYPALHRWLGRVYVLASIFAALGGLSFILLKGTVGGLVMDIGFGLYGVLMLGAAIATLTFARKGLMDQHRAWAIRLFALAIGSWLYRMDYGFWFLLADGWGHLGNFRGPFDRFMDFFFYVPNLLVAEAYLGRRLIFRSPGLQWGAAAIVLLASVFILLGSYFFTKHLWGPAILGVFGG